MTNFTTRYGLKHTCSRHLICVAELQNLDLRGKGGQQVPAKSLNERMKVKNHPVKGGTEKESPKGRIKAPKSGLCFELASRVTCLSIRCRKPKQNLSFCRNSDLILAGRGY